MSKTRRTLLILLALAVLKRPADILLAALLPDATVNPVPACVTGMLVSLLLLALPAWLLRPWTSPRLIRTVTPAAEVGMAVMAAVLARMALPPLDTAWQSWLRLTPAPLPAPGGILMAALYALTLAVTPAMAEEAFFRGALLTSLLDGSRRMTALLLTTLAFTLMHAHAANLPSLLIVSLLLTGLMLRTGNIAVPMTAHLLYNLTALVSLRIPLWGSVLCGTVLAGLVMMLCFRRQEMAHPQMKRLDGWLAAAALCVLAALYFV